MVHQDVGTHNRRQWGVAAKSIDLLTKTKRKIARGPNLNWCQRNDNALFSFSASLAADLRRIWRAQNHRLKSLSFCEWNRLNWNDHDLDCWLKAGRFATLRREMKYNCWSMWTRGSHKACNYHSIMIHVICCSAIIGPLHMRLLSFSDQLVLRCRLEITKGRIPCLRYSPLWLPRTKMLAF